MILNAGDIVLVSHRRIFERDEARYFLGRTVACEGDLLKLDGFTFARDLANGHMVKKNEWRTKLLSLTSPGYIVYQLPNDVDIEQAYIHNRNGETVLVDGARELMNLSERTHSGRF